ncbi:MAG: hypothetical protein K2O14_06135 [Oscillospiraceae bacterium]|nr:hypothetical protein [Oscillospiraceae bacterium]
MNVAQLRDYMAEKVIPEKVMPQNIAEFLMDEEAELPELNAFTFLNRLRSLGIGSADFLYLLEGCEAPAEAVERIRRNPAMNLQSLIITLDSSGLTSQDYTRMLYTARQMWERTLTMRLENMAPNVRPQGDPLGDTAEIAFNEEIAPEEPNEAPIEAEEPTETLPEPEYTSEMTAAENEEYPEPDDDPELLAAMAYYKNIFSSIGDESGENAGDSCSEIHAAETEPPEAVPEEAADSFDDIRETGETDEEYGEVTEPPAPPYEPNEREEQEFEGTSEFVQIDANQIMQELTSTLDEDRDGDEPQPEPVRTRQEGGYHKRALISAAVGAAAVFGAGAAVSAMGFEPSGVPVLSRAAEYTDVFAQTHSSYNAKILGGEPFRLQNGGEILGELLIEPAEGLGVFNTDGYVYTAESDIIIVYERGAALSESGTLAPPKGTEFIRVFEQDGAVFAVFSGKSCGFMRVEENEPVFVSEQDGVLTDIIIEDGCVKLGSVYLPEFTEDFTAEQIDKYLPETGAAGVIAAEKVLLSGEGCGYAVSAAYDTADGSVISSGAVMGRAVYSAADGSFAALEYGEGVLLAALSEDIVTENAGELLGCARAGELTATAERCDEGTVIYLRGADMKPLYAINNLSEDVVSLAFSGDTLLISGDKGVFAAIDCADAEEPAPLDLTRKTGAVKDGYALCGELSGALLTYTLYNGDGAVSSYSVTLSERELSTLILGGRNTMVIDPERCGFSFDCFDGVCTVSKYIVFGHSSAEETLFDDKTGFTAAAELDGKICLIYGAGSMTVG